jgi:hypothetical protein
MGVGGQRHAPAALPPGKRAGTPCIGGWMSPRAGLDGRRKYDPPTGFDPRTVQPVAIRHSDYSIPAHMIDQYGPKCTNSLFLETLTIK